MGQPEAKSSELPAICAKERRPTIWWATPVECRSAIQRRSRQEPLSAADIERALARLTIFLEDSHIVGATDEVRGRAGRLVATHPLRAADALQLAAALVWYEERPSDQMFLCLDDRLREAARREGFTVLPA